MTSNENIKQYIREIYTPSEYITSTTYIEPENFDINKVTQVIKKNKNWVHIEYQYEYSEEIKDILNFKTNFSKFSSKNQRNTFEHFEIDINSQENLNLRQVMSKIDSLTFESIKNIYKPNKNCFNFFSTHMTDLNIFHNNDPISRWIKCVPYLKYGVPQTKTIIYNSRTKIIKGIETGNKINLYDEYTDIKSDTFCNLMKNLVKKDNYGGYQSKYILSPKVVLGPLNNAEYGYYSNFRASQVEIKHLKSNIDSIIDNSEMTIHKLDCSTVYI